MGKRSTPRLQVVLNFIQMTILQFLEWAQVTKDLIAANPDITTPVVGMTAVQDHIDALQATVDSRQTDRSTSLTTEQQLEANVLYSDFTYLCGQCEMIGNQKIEAAGGDYSAGLSFIQALNLRAKNIGTRGEQVFEVAATEAPGKAFLRCPSAGKDSIYIWRCSKAPANGWSTPVQTRVASVNLVELDGDCRYWFQFAVVHNAGLGATIDPSNPGYAWSDPISALVPGNPA